MHSKDGIAKIASAFYPKQAIVRMSDFKSNEYYNLLGGSYFEPTEENPMIGWRGASRYYSDEYEYAFGMECKAIKRVREKMGLSNITIMIPFCRTVKELKSVLENTSRGSDSSNQIVQDGILKIFGKKMTVSELCLEILGDIEKNGDSSLRKLNSSGTI